MTILRKVCSHPIWWLFCLLSIAASPQLSAVTPPSVTQVIGTIFRADGKPAAGQVIVSWPPFTTVDNSPVAGGTKSVTLAPDGTINISLFPTVGATPSGTVYTDFFVNQAHNDILQLLVETGLIGLAVGIWFVWGMYRAAIKRLFAPRFSDQSAWILGAVVGCSGILLHSLFDFNLHIAANAAWFYVLASSIAIPERSRV